MIWRRRSLGLLGLWTVIWIFSYVLLVILTMISVPIRVAMIGLVHIVTLA